LFSVTEPSLVTSSVMPDKVDSQGKQEVAADAAVDADDDDDEFGSAGVVDDSFTRKKKLSHGEAGVVVLSGVTVSSVSSDTLFQLEDTTTTVKIVSFLQLAVTDL